VKRRLGETEECFVVLLERFARERLERGGQVMSRLGEQQLLFFDVFDGIGGLGFRNGTRSHSFGKIVAKVIEFRVIGAAASAQLFGKRLSTLGTLGGTRDFCLELRSETGRPPQPSCQSPEQETCR